MPSNNAQDVVNRIAGQGLAGFIRKPFRLGELVTALREALEGGSKATSNGEVT